jgi:acyl carrier protein
MAATVGAALWRVVSGSHAGLTMEIIDEVRQLIAKSLKIPVEKLTAETRLDEIGAESLDVIEIVFELEEKFGISIPFQANQPSGDQPQQDLPFTTIGDVAKAVKELVDAKATT